MNASRFVLRPCEEGDFPALLDLWVAAWTKTDFILDFEARRAWLEDHLRTLRARGVAIVVGLGADGRPAGFATIDTRSGYLDQLCVAPAEQGSGLALALLDEAKHRSPGMVALDVNETNARALRFYEREGFAIVGRGVSERSGLPTLKMAWRGAGEG